MTAVAGPAEGRPLTRMRRVIATRMRASVATKPHVTLHTHASATTLLGHRRDSGPGMTAQVVWAVARVLTQHPDVNTWLLDDRLVAVDRVNVGVAVDVPGGLLVPVIHDADRLDPSQIQASLTDQAARARSGRLNADDMADATFTVSTLGGLGVGHFTPIISPPQVAILGVGALESSALVVDGVARAEQRLPLSLSFDHAALDGAPAARFLRAVVKQLELGITAGAAMEGVVGDGPLG